ncbi:MAG TPA: hypothetical protein VFI31_12725 [Pirellulales bacterium]|nr:hypothetical protein [Pirellulales bacterium]
MNYEPESYLRAIAAARSGGSAWLAKPGTWHKASPGTLCGFLLAVHLAADVGLASVFQVHKVTLANWCFTLLVGGQLCLVGLWAGLAWRRETRRALSCIAGMVLGSAWLWSIVLTATQTWHRDRLRWFAARICLTVIVTTFAGTAVVRWRWLELARQDGARQPRRQKERAA